MQVSLHITKAQLRIFSSIFSNLIIVWLSAIFATQDKFAWIINLVYASICWKIAVRAEELLEEYD